MAEVNPKESLRDDLAEAWLKLMKEKLDDKTINATESAILMRVLMNSGFTLDPTRLPQGLRDKLTEHLDVNDPVTAEELGIAGTIRRRA